MAYSRGNQGYVMLSDKQSALTTKKVPTYTGTIAAGEDLQLVKPSKQVFTDRIRNRVAPSYTQKGTIHVEGTLTFDDIPDEALGINLAMLSGSLNTVTGTVSTGYTHTMNFWSSCSDFPTNGITVQKLVGGCDNTKLVDNIGCFVNTFTYTVPEDGVATYGVSYMGINNSWGGTLATPSYSAVAPVEGWMSQLKIGSAIGSVAAVNLKSCTLTINNNLQLITDHNVSNQYPSGYVPNSRTCEFTFEVSQEDSLTLYNYFVDTENAVQLVMTHPDNAGTTSGVYSRTFNLPRVTWLGEEPKLDSADVLTGTYTMQALWDEDLGYDVLATIVNSQSGTYSV